MTTITQNNVVLLHRKEWQTMMPAQNNTAAGSLLISSKSGLENEILYLATNTVHYLYHKDEDDYCQITSGAFAVALAAGACGCYHPWSVTYTANGGTTGTTTVAAASHNLVGKVRGKTIEFLTGTAANVGLRRTITEIDTIGTGNITLYLDTPLPADVANTDTFKIQTGSYFVLNAGTLAVNTYFRRFDLGTRAWFGLAVTGLPATWGTDGQLVTPSMYNVSYDSGTCTAGSNATTVEDTTRAWGTNQWVNYQVRITEGVGCGQVRLITANNATTLTIAAGATLDDTSKYSIEGEDDAIYVMGSAAVTLYKYSISANTTSTVTVTSARSAAPAAGMSGDFVGITGDNVWADKTNIKDGKYIYSLRGTSALLDRYDITTKAWAQVNFVNPITFGLGDSTCWDCRYIYIMKEGSASVPLRFYKYSVRGNYIEPLTTDWYLGGAAVIGNKMTIEYLPDSDVKWLYYIGSTTNLLRRIMIF